MTEEELSNENLPKGEEQNFTKHMNSLNCASHRQKQRQGCRCVKPENQKTAFEEAIQGFYKNLKEKVPEGKELKKIVSKWDGDSPGLFDALIKKYKKKAVTVTESMRQRSMRDMMANIKSGGFDPR